MAASTAAPDVVEEPTGPVYGGVATRAVALGIDAGIIWVTLLIIGAFFAAITAIVGDVHFGPIGKFLVGSAALVFAGLYFVVAWTSAGRTIGQRMMGLRVIDENGAQPRFVRAVIRAVMLGLCIVCAFAGFIPVLFDRRRRGVHDMVARTTVLYAPEEAVDVITPGSSPSAPGSRSRPA